MATATAGWAESRVLTPFKPTSAEVLELYQRSQGLGQNVTGQLVQLRLDPNWIGDEQFWYRRDVRAGHWEYTVVASATGAGQPLFDHSALASALAEASGRNVDGARLNLQDLRVSDNQHTVHFRFADKNYRWDKGAGKLEEATSAEAFQQRGGGQGNNRARVQDGKVQVRLTNSSEWTTVSEQDGFTRTNVSPDGRFAVGTRVIPGDRKEVFTVRSNDANQTRGILETRRYDQPGDKLDTSEYFFYDMATGKEVKVDVPPVVNGGWPWANPPGIRWWRPQGSEQWSFTVQYLIRGYQQYQVLRVYPEAGRWDIMIDEKNETFVDTGDLQIQFLEQSDAALWLSERDGWSHIYWIDGKTGAARQITRGEWVVRNITWVDEENGEIIFRANGREEGDPYFQHTYSIKFDGSGLKRLTDGEGMQNVSWSPGHKYIVSSWSRVDKAPVHELRTRSGEQVKVLAEVDAAPLRQAGIQGPTVFTAKGRDGVTDIWGIIHFPTHFDPDKTYPVIEDIYAGPHDSHVPKTFSPVFYQQRLAELGFIVVQIDGMGTDNRGKAFHDVCWQNLKDAGFPDRILWMKAAAEKYPQMDLDRVGIFGTSAGGQNSAGALLFHPEFYKVAVSSCGCHDNRIDKFWWNEQWMGYPVGDHYAASSNIDHAGNLVGKLMLIVGEIDSNVPPESTFRFADALMKANKEFELVHLPGLNHTAGGQFGERKRCDFFVRHLLGVDPPNWNTMN